jgi:PAS domain S-box-containing protein
VRLLRALQESNEEFAAAQQFAHVGSWRYDVVHDELEWSAELYRITGVPEGSRPARPTGGSLFGFEHPADRGRIVAAIRRAVETREPFTFDMRIIRQDNGEVREVTTTGTLLYDDAGALVRIWGATQDVTQRRRAERARVAALTELERQRAAVSELQQVILPVQLPQPAGARIAANYRAASSAEAVGGDWYDAFEAPDGRVILTVGDVAGHGVKCAALANQLRVSVRIRVQDGMEPGAILALLDSELIGDFATCWLAAFEPETRRLRVASARHLPALLCRRDSGTLVAAHTRPPLGTHVPDRLDEHILELVPGDLLVACTDGLIERRGEHLDRGFERLMDVAPTARTNDDPALALVEALAVETVDDVCVLTLQVW